MEAMVMTVLLPNVAMAALLSRHPKSTRATMAASAVKDMGILFVKNRTSITTNSAIQITIGDILFSSSAFLWIRLCPPLPTKRATFPCAGQSRSVDPGLYLRRYGGRVFLTTCALAEFLLGPAYDLGVLQRVNGRPGHDLGGIKHPLFCHSRFPYSYHLVAALICATGQFQLTSPTSEETKP